MVGTGRNIPGGAWEASAVTVEGEGEEELQMELTEDSLEAKKN